MAGAAVIAIKCPGCLGLEPLHYGGRGPLCGRCLQTHTEDADHLVCGTCQARLAIEVDIVLAAKRQREER